jgi:glycosyltransferase involved in cell wall biosynthesis
MSPLAISVAMCTFNGARFLDAQLESLAAQDRQPDELIVCDDASSDNSCEIIREFARRAGFAVRLVVNDKNLGTTKNFEKAIEICQAPIIALADQDDVWYAHKLDRIERHFLASSFVVAVFSDADIIDEHSRALRQRLWRTNGFNRKEQIEFSNGGGFSVLIKHPVVTGATMAFRKQLLDVLMPIPATEIHDLWISFLLTALGRIELISEPLMQYRRHQSQQIGPGPVTAHEVMAQARNRGSHFYAQEILKFRQFHRRLQECGPRFPNRERAIQEIEGKIRHLEHRAQLSPTKIARIPEVLRESLKGHYSRYSGGWKSIAKDLAF